jgi:hypothetical protein
MDVMPRCPWLWHLLVKLFNIGARRSLNFNHAFVDSRQAMHHDITGILAMAPRIPLETSLAAAIVVGSPCLRKGKHGNFFSLSIVVISAPPGLH